MRYNVIVVGGGIAGASIAYWLSSRARVLLIERESGYGYHSTGRSAAEWSAVHYPGVFGALTRLGKPFFDAPPAGFSDGPLLRRRGNILFTLHGDEHAGEALLARTREIAPDTMEISLDRALEIVPILRRERISRCYYDPNNYEIDVDRLLQGYLRGVRTNGSDTVTGVELTQAQRRDGVWHAQVGDREVSAPLIVNASGAWGDVVAERCGVAPIGLTPCKRTAITFDCGLDVREWPPVDQLNGDFYFKPEAGLLMVCPGDETPVAPCDAQADEYEVALAAHLMEEYTTAKVERIASRWAGLRSFLKDRLPAAGFAEAPGFFWLVGQGGAGIMSSAGLGRVAAHLALGEAVPEDAAGLGIRAEQLSPKRLDV
jgi:D-arginine dehydrogenase